MNRIFYLITIFIFLQPVIYSQQGWQLIYSFQEDVAAICFIDRQTGFAGSGFNASTKMIMKTTDSGNSWNELVITNNVITRIYFYNYNIGFAIGENGIFYKTTDRGVNWILAPLGETETLRGIYFYTEQLGWACIGADKILRTTNGGNNWKSSFTNGAIANYDIEFIDELNGFTVGVYARMYNSTDGGASWNQISTPIATSMFDIEFFDQSIGLVVSGNGIARTIDGGNSWSIVLNSGGSQLNSVCTFGSKFAWAVGQNKIYYTSNSCETWTSQSFTPDSYLQQVSCADSVNVWVLGDRKLYRTSSGGVTDVTNETNLYPELFSLNQNYPNPFNPTTIIAYQIPQTKFVTLKVYDILGREVATLVNEEKSAGSYEVQFTANGLTSGIYFYQLKAGDYTETKKMILLR
jgi:photosystem II stability/assembly factor-like uncharacterized protein